MRLYHSFPEAFNEIKRDLAELGVTVQPETMQDKYVADDEDYTTKELANYMYQVTKPDFNEVPGVHEEWVNQEFQDRLIGDLNPGKAWRLRPEVWKEFLEADKGTHGGRYEHEHTGMFSYSYSQRMGGDHINRIIEELKVHPHSRQLWLPVWWPIDETRRGQRRVPCSLGYWLVQRQGQLHITYMMRSCDFITHMPNDVALATMLLYHVARETGFKVGTFTHTIGSLHCYRKDVKGVF